MLVDKQKRSEYRRAYYLAHKKQHVASYKKWMDKPGNRKRRNEQARLWRKANPARYRELELKRLYGIEMSDYEKILASQNQCCAICGEVLGSGSKTHLDHCHSTGEVRGILCRHCNLAIAHLKDSPGNAIAAAHYLQEGRAGAYSVT